MATTRTRAPRAKKPKQADKLPITAAELDAMQGDDRRAAELERSAIIEQAVKDAGDKQLPQLGGELPESERGPIVDPTPRNRDPQQAAVEEAVASIDWEAQRQAQRAAEAAAREAWE